MEEAERTGAVEPEERSMIDGVMRLGDRSVRGIMTPRTDLKWIDLQGSEREVVTALKAAQHERLLVANGSIDELVGAIPVRSALVALLEKDLGEVWRLVEKVPVVSERLSALDAIEQLRQSPLNLLIVVDEHGTVEGIVTEGDVLKTIVADIAEDEGPRIVERDDAWLLIDGSFPIDKIRDRLDIVLPPSHDYHTVAGFVLDRMRRLPRIGESFQYGGWRFEVVDVDGRRIDKVIRLSGRRAAVVKVVWACFTALGLAACAANATSEEAAASRVIAEGRTVYGVDADTEQGGAVGTPLAPAAPPADRLYSAL